MDPDTTLEQLRKLVAESRDRSLDTDHRAECAEGALDLFDALDEWLSKGGFLPEDWGKRWVR